MSITFFLCLSLLGGCANHSPSANLDKAGVLALSEIVGIQGTEIPGLPFFPQQSDQCGPASLATVLAHEGVEISPEELKRLVYIPAKGGSLAVELRAQTRRQGLLAYALSPNLSDLLLELAAGRPVLVMQNLGFSWWPKWHFAVVIGFDLVDRQMILRSGLESRYRIHIDLFNKTWARANNWALVALRPGDMPASAEALPYLRASADLEESGQYQAALMAYKGASEKWPDQPTALFGMANTQMALERFAQALSTYQALLRVYPRRAEAWNNMAFALSHLGCAEEALNSVKCALKLSPQNKNFLDTRNQVKNFDDRGLACHGEIKAECPL